MQKIRNVLYFYRFSNYTYEKIKQCTQEHTA